MATTRNTTAATTDWMGDYFNSQAVLLAQEEDRHWLNNITAVNNDLARNVQSGFVEATTRIPPPPVLPVTEIQIDLAPPEIRPISNPSVPNSYYTYAGPSPTRWESSYWNTPVQVTQVSEPIYSSYEIKYVNALITGKSDAEKKVRIMKESIKAFLKSVSTMKELPASFFGTPEAVVIYMDLLANSLLGKTDE